MFCCFDIYIAKINEILLYIILVRRIPNWPFNITVYYYIDTLQMFNVNSLVRIVQFIKIASCLRISSNLGIQELMGSE